MYTAVKTVVPEKWHEKLKARIMKDKILPIKISLESGDDTLLLTKGQIIKMDEARKAGKKDILLRFSRKQVRANLQHEGGFLATLAGLATKILPTLLGSLATGVIGGLAERAIARSGTGLYLSKRGRGCTEINFVEGGGLYLSPLFNPEDNYDGLYIKHDGETYKGSGLILGKNSPFKDIPILGWLL